MQEVFEKIKKNLVTELTFCSGYPNCSEYDYAYEVAMYDARNKATAIVNQVAEEYNNGWISVEERLPDEEDSMFAKYKGTDKWSAGMFEKTSKTVQVIISDPKGKCVIHVAHTVDGKWNCDLLRINKNYKITHWQPLTEQYQPKGDKE